MARQAEAREEQPEKAWRFEDFREQGDVISGLLHTLQEGTFVHAYLITGMAGVGKRSLASLIARYLLCTCDRDAGNSLLAGLDLPPAEKPCGVCPACMQVLSGNHPDLVRMGRGVHISQDSKDQTKKGIVIGDVREAVRLVGTHTYEGGRRVIIIDEAETMTAQAQNCLLKTLEEPTEGTVFLLLTDSPSLLLPTIISRCRQLSLHAWPEAKLLAILREEHVPAERQQEILRSCGGSIGAALRLASDEAYWQRRADVMRDFFALERRSDIARVTESWRTRKDELDALLDDIENLLHTLLLVRWGQLPDSVLTSYPAPWQRMAKGADAAAFVRLLDAVHEARKYRLSQVTGQAVLDRLLLRLMEEKTRW